MTDQHNVPIERLEKRIEEVREEAHFWRDEVLELIDEGERGSEEHQEALENFWRARRELAEAQRALNRHDR